MKTKDVLVNDKMQKNFIYKLTAPMGRNFDPRFKPELTPKQMLSLGIFGGKYMTDCKNEFPFDWYKNAKLCSEKHEAKLNFFGVNASQPLSVWRKKGWIYKDDPRGWFQWYCRYFMGRRLEIEDDRQIKRWLDEINFTTKSGKELHLSTIYLMLKNPFYYGEFEYPAKSGNWYKGSYPSLITKEIFDKVQEKLTVPPKKSKWGSKTFIYKGLLRCASCKASIVGEDRYRERLNQPPRYHIYYHCSRQINHNCKEPYVSEEKLEKSLFKFINFMYIAHPHELFLTEKIQQGISDFQKMREAILLQQNIDPDSSPWDIRDYVRYVLTNKNIEEKRELFNLFKFPLFIQNSTITSLRAH